MKRQDYLIFMALVALLLAWPYIDRNIIRKYFYGDHPPAARAEPARSAELAPRATDATDAAPPAAPKPDLVAPAATALPEEAAPPPDAPEQTAVLRNDHVRLVLGSRGGGIREATLVNYPSTMAKDSGPVVMSFDRRRALAYLNLPGLTHLHPFELRAAADGLTADIERRAANGLRMIRSMALGTGYVVRITDILRNESEGALEVPATDIQLGLMQNLHAGESSFGMVYLGVDTLSPGGEGVKHWGGKLAALFKTEMAAANLLKLPVEVYRAPDARPVDWVAVKNKYFAQILVPAEGGEGFSIYARREVTPRELKDPDYQPKLGAIEDVSAAIKIAPAVLQPGQAVTNQYQYFIGPKKYDELSALGLHQVGVMELGDWIRPIATLLLKTLNLIHEHVWPHNYGVAIMLLTIIIRVIFWPITHKSTESMKRMAEVQPLVTEIRAKYKDNPQKMQQEIMALYKAHKINPLGGCLPMLIQIPVFFALFVVLRSAIELRFASFLWIKDLSEPENLLAGVLPLPLNILPILMALTMYWQQKLTPTAGDPAQAKMMRILMPGMMLVFLYNFASGLALYWTTQNILMIVQQLHTLRKQKLKAQAAKAQAPGK